MNLKPLQSGKLCRQLALFFCLIAANSPVLAEIDPDLDSRFWTLFYEDKYAEAMTMAEQCEHDAIKLHGNDHPDVASCVAWQATLQYAQGNFDQSVTLTLRELSINEKAFGPNHTDVAVSLSSLADGYQAQKKYIDARTYYQRALSIYEKNESYYGPKIASTLCSLAELLVAQSRYQEAVPLYERALAISKKSKLGLEDKSVAEVMDALAGLYEKLGASGKAKGLQQQAIQLTEANLGSDPLEIAAGAGTRAKRYQAQALYAQAEPLWLLSLKIKTDQFGPEDSLVLKATADLAGFYSQTLQFAKAQVLYEKILAIREAKLGKEHPDVATTLGNLALMYDKQGLYVRAELLYLRAIAILEKTYGQYAALLPALNGLGLMYMNQGRLTQAELLLKRTLAIAEKSFAEGDPKLAISLYNLATIYQQENKFEAAEVLLKRALANAEKFRPATIHNMATTMQELHQEQNDFAQADPLLQYALGADENFLGKEHPLYGAFQKSLASLYVRQGRYAEAEPLFKEAVRIFEKPLGMANPGIASVLSEWAKLYLAQARFAEAEPLQLRALSIMEKALGRDHPMLAPYLFDLANMHLAQNRLDDALAISQQACELLRNRFLAASSDKLGGNQLSEQQLRRNIFLQRLQLLSIRQSQSALPLSQANESFEMAQLARASSVGQSVGQMAARFATGGDELAGLIRDQQDTVSKLAQANQGLLETLGRPSEQEQQEATNQLRKEIVRLNQLLDEQDRQLSEKFPQYRNLINQAPVTAKQVQDLLQANEAMLVYTVTEQGAYVWILKQHQMQFRHLSIKQAEIETQVRFLRSKLQPDANGHLPAFTASTSHRLYQAIFAPAEAYLTDVKHILLVNEDALQGLPFGILGWNDTGASPHWLAERFAFSILPSVNALKALRVFTQRSIARKPFVGFGDPVLNDAVDISADVNPRALFRLGNFSAGNADTLHGIADVDAIRKANSLPQTATELRAIAQALKASDDDVFLRERATETRVKSLDLSQYRFIAFATHGVVAGEMPGLAEPGLILTPPNTGTANDDGYLASTEIAQLKLNADWVLLSACNTATADGSGSGEGLSGLAKAFFYAGSRSLLVSNWPVDSLATQKLITRTMGLYSSTPGVGKSDALQQAMLEMIVTEQYSHPFYWAPFSVIGE